MHASVYLFHCVSSPEQVSSFLLGWSVFIYRLGFGLSDSSLYSPFSSLLFFFVSLSVWLFWTVVLYCTFYLVECPCLPVWFCSNIPFLVVYFLFFLYFNVIFVCFCVNVLALLFLLLFYFYSFSLHPYLFVFFSLSVPVLFFCFIIFFASVLFLI